ncbi:MAG: site-specific integrase [Chloroflexi bacterium]|nr:site-specific integrase [Chloroflexota bacterium]MYD49045.1 site-specific integrase [Chloroflexota bacterium]
MLLWRTALRQAEALNLDWRDLQFAGVQPSVTVRNGKDGKYRVVPAYTELVDTFQSGPHRGWGQDFRWTRRQSTFVQDRGAVNSLAKVAARQYYPSRGTSAPLWRLLRG